MLRRKTSLRTLVLVQSLWARGAVSNPGRYIIYGVMIVPQRPMTSHHGMSSQYTQPTLRTPQDGIPQQPSSAFGREPHLIYQPSSTIGGRMGQVYDENMLESNVSSVSQGEYYIQ